MVCVKSLKSPSTLVRRSYLGSQFNHMIRLPFPIRKSSDCTRRLQKVKPGIEMSIESHRDPTNRRDAQS